MSVLSKKRVKIYHSNTSYNKLFTEGGYTLVDSLEDADLIVFTGGADVTPSMYGEKSHPKTYSEPSRDRAEELVWVESQERGIPAVGICRGGQLLNVLNGGKMHQHIVGHATGSNHLITDVASGTNIMVSSTHHQMMIPSDKGVVLAVADIVDWPKGEEQEDIEVVYYPETNNLCFQPHPEFFYNRSPCVDYFFNCINEWVMV